MSDSHEDRKKKLLEMLDDPGAIQEFMDCFDVDYETAREMWELFKNDLLPDIS